MLRILVGRFLAIIPVLFAATVIIFLMVHMAPGSAAVIVAGGSDADPESIARAREMLGLNDPIWEQYLRMISRFMSGDFGTSYISSLSVSEAIATRIPATLSVAGGAILLGLLIAVPAGIAAALNQGGLPDRIITGLATLGIATPEFFLGVMLVAAFAIGLGWFPAVGYVPIEEGFAAWGRHLVLPCVTLGLGSAAQISRHLRAAMRDVLLQDYMRTARAKGLPEWKVIGKHAFKNAAIPVITVVGLQLQSLLAGSVIVETVFAVRGIGGLLILSVNNRDIPMIQGIVMVMVLSVILVNFVVDISYRLLNPKMRNG